MRKLVILRGPMGSGKSTFIKENGLEIYTLSTDNIRLLFNSLEMTSSYREVIPQFNNKKVWDLLFYLLEERMKKGEFTIIDAVHAFYDESLIKYKKFAEKYRYRLYILDFTNISKEELYKRNLNREEYKIVPEYAIDRVCNAFSRVVIPSSFQIVKPENFSDIIKNVPKDFNNFQHIHILGDIHGCYRALKEYFDKYKIEKNDAYIFVGDYFDRGVENANTFNYLRELMKNDNMFFLVGNHEDKLYKYACDDDFKMDYDLKNTIEEFENNHIKKSEIRGFIKSLSQIVYFKFGNKVYLVSHGGLPYFPKRSLDFYSTNSLIYGVCAYDVNIDKLYDDFMKQSKQKIYQVHGHRNYYKLKYNVYPYSLNLEGDIEHGGSLRILTLNKNAKSSLKEIKNKVYNPNLIQETKVYNLVIDLRKNKYIFEKQLDDNLSSFNFSKEAFYNRIWDNITTQARGLFIDVKNSKIVARSYNKFFNINERKETKLEELENLLVFPVNFYLKYNGFLGILSIYNDELFFASKSTNTGNYVNYFQEIFFKIFNAKQIKQIKNKLIKENLTFVFEVIDPVNDPHIIKYDKEAIILLDAIKNDVEFSKIDYLELKHFAEEINVVIKDQSYIARSLKDFKKIYEEISQTDFKYQDNYVEGFVIEDMNNLMVKFKTAYYSEWKYLRNKMESAIKNNNYNLKCQTDLEKNFMIYLENKYKNKNVDIESVNIIEEREKYFQTSNQ